MKSEPESRFEDGVDVKFGIDDLEASPDQTAPWDGVRNYQVWDHTASSHVRGIVNLNQSITVWCLFGTE